MVSDVPKQVSRAAKAEVDAAQALLVEKELVGSEFVVVCKKSNTQVARAPSREAIIAMQELGARCGCGRRY